MTDSSVLAISVPVNNPDDERYVVPEGQEYTGVVLLEMEDDICTGSLVSDRHILSAAHCFETNSEGSERVTRNPNPHQVTVLFSLPDEYVEMDVARIIMHPGWRNDEGYNNDLAILELVESAPEEAERYALYRDNNEMGRVFTRVGFGIRATGAKGEDDDEEESILRFGQNRYEAFGDIFNEAGYEAVNEPGTQLVYDFDSGKPANDALGIEFGERDLGLGRKEIGSSSGDSGGPAFINGRLAGISSTGMEPGTEGIDVTDENDTSFGEYFFDTRVSAFADYIDQVIGGQAVGEATIGENNVGQTAMGEQSIREQAPGRSVRGNLSTNAETSVRTPNREISDRLETSSKTMRGESSSDARHLTDSVNPSTQSEAYASIPSETHASTPSAVDSAYSEQPSDVEPLGNAEAPTLSWSFWMPIGLVVMGGCCWMMRSRR